MKKVPSSYTRMFPVTRRRDFLKTSVAAGAGALLAKLDIASVAHAAGSDQIKIALIGCGGRGTARRPTQSRMCNIKS
jgi:anaerobic selenocysteine-containing dehydrogenase